MQKPRPEENPEHSAEHGPGHRLTLNPALDPERLRLALAAAAYKTDTVRLFRRELGGYTHVVASRRGLFAVREDGFVLLAHGLFFGLAIRGDELFAFEACDLPRSPSRMGRIVRFAVRDGTIVKAEVAAKGLDNGCHQIDFAGGRLHVVDTYAQQILRFAAGEASWEVLRPLPAAGERGGGPGYVHVNSLLAVGKRFLLLLHGGGGERQSEIAVFDPECCDQACCGQACCGQQWCEVERWPLQGVGCHGLALLEDGTVLTCGSKEGTLISTAGLCVPVSPWMTRGLSVGADSIVVGASERVEREGRLRSAGTVTFLDRAYRVRAVLEIPGAPTEIRRLDGLDRFGEQRGGAACPG